MTDARIRREGDKAANKFHRVMRALVRVPKAEVEEHDREERKAKLRKTKKSHEDPEGNERGG